MDKKKTGNLIREARIKKNYTQIELGDILGVTNKAVSRWENGESFPDVGILENLANVLDVSIQDIVTGSAEVSDDTAITEVVRFARLQQQEKKRRIWNRIVYVVILLACSFSGYQALISRRDFSINRADILLDFIMLFVVAMALIICYLDKGNIDDVNISICTAFKRIAIISLIYCIIMMWSVLVSVVNGMIPFGMELSSVGPFINWQLIILFIVNIILMLIEMVFYDKNGMTIRQELFISVAVVFLTALYGDLIHSLSTFNEVIGNLCARTLIVLLAIALSLVARKVIVNKSV